MHGKGAEELHTQSEFSFLTSWMLEFLRLLLHLGLDLRIFVVVVVCLLYIFCSLLKTCLKDRSSVFLVAAKMLSHTAVSLQINRQNKEGGHVQAATGT